MPGAITVTRWYLELIRTGRKTSTIRPWSRDVCKKLRRGARLTFTDYRSSVRTECTGARQATVGELTIEDATTDGFASLDELLRALQTHYPDLHADSRVCIVRFRVLNPSDQSAAATRAS